MRIVTFQSSNAPPEKSWVAYWLVPVKPKGDAHTPADPEVADKAPWVPKEGVMPYSFWGSSEQEVIDKAQKGWDTSFGKNEKRRRDLAAIRTRSRPAAKDHA